MCPHTDSLLSLLHCEDVWSKGEAVLYCVGSLKLLSGNSALSRLLLSKGFIGVLLQLSKRLMHGPSSTSAYITSHRSEGEGQRIIVGHILVQVCDRWGLFRLGRSQGQSCFIVCCFQYGYHVRKHTDTLKQWMILVTIDFHCMDQETLKGIVHPKNKILSWITRPHVVPNA